MTDASSASDYDAAFRRLQAQEAARHRLVAQALAPSKAALFDALAPAEIAAVIVSFDGYGDSGQIEAIEARAGDDKIEPPAVTIEIAGPAWDGSGLERRPLPLADAIMELVYDLLNDTHPGWENNDGAFGEFTCDIAERGISLEHHSCYTEVATSGHEW